jgi:hypothetical protein
MTYVHQAWPSWRFGPDGASQIFESEDEVPEGWVDSPSKLKGKKAPAEPATPPSADKAAKINELVEGNSQTELVAMLEKMHEADDSIEFATNWPKAKLAATIVDNGGPLEE